jgi:hypothetical protein
MRVVYLPFYVPYTISQIAAHVLVVIACVLLAVAFTTKEWSVTEIELPPTSAVIGVHINMHSSLRAVSLQRCETRGQEPADCVDVDLVYDDCTPNDAFCDIAPSALWCYGLSIAGFVVCVLASLTGFFRPRNQVHVLAVAMVLVSCVQILYSSVTHTRYTQGLVQRERMMFEGQTYYYRNILGWSFYVSMAANFLILIGLALSHQGYYRDMKKDAALEALEGGTSGVDTTGDAVPMEHVGSRVPEPSRGPVDGRYSPEGDDAGGEFGLVTSLPPTRSFPMPK